MWKNKFQIVFLCGAFLLSALNAEAASDVATNSAAWARNNVTNTDINTSGVNADTTYALAADGEKVEIAAMIRNTGDAVSGTIKILRTGDAEATYVNNTLRKYSGGTWTDIFGEWNNLNTAGTKLNLGTINNGSYIRVIYQLDLGSSHTFGDVIQDYLGIYEDDVLKTTLAVKVYVPYLKISSAGDGDDTVVLTSAVSLLETAAETIGNFEVSKNNGGSFTALAGPSTATYDDTGRTVTLAQSQVDFTAGNSIVVRVSNLKTSDNLRFLNTTNFTAAGALTLPAFTATDTSAPTFTADYDAAIGDKGVLLLTFNEAMDTNTLATANVLARTTFNNGHDIGTAPTVVWPANTSAKIYLDSDGTIAVNDTITLDNNIKDANGNAVSGGAVTINAANIAVPTITAFTIADQTSGSANYTNSRTINVASFTASDADGLVSGYLVNENAATPAVGAITSNSAPATYAITGVEGARTVYAWVKDNDDHISASSSKNITLDLTNPTIQSNIDTGTYNSAQTVTLSFNVETNPDKIYYTTDNSIPDNTDTEYTAPLSINSNTTLKFIGYDLAENTSSVATKTYTFACNPSSVTNGSVGAYPTCAISCNAGYTVSGNSCIITSGGGGGGGGGSSGVDTTSIYQMPATSANNTITLYRPVRLAGNAFTRNVILENYYTKAIAEIKNGTEVFDLAGKVLTNGVIYPPSTVKASQAETDLRVPYPAEKLLYANYYQFGSLQEKFSAKIKLSFSAPSAIRKLTPADVLILKWQEGQMTSSLPIFLAGDATVIYRSGEWIEVGDGSLIDAAGKLKIEIDASTLIAFASKTATTGTGAEAVAKFQDIQGHWAQNYIEELYRLKIVSGKTATSFAPDDNLTRAELTKIALNSFGYTLSGSVATAPFSDVAADAWYAPYIEKAKEAGILQGYSDGTFRPNQPINRAEALKILLGVAGVQLTGFTPDFVDTDKNAWYAPYVGYAQTKGIVEGYAVKVEIQEEAGQGKLVQDQYTFKRYLGEGDQGADVLDLQKVLQILGYYKGDLTGKYDALTAQAVSQYQLSEKVILSASDYGAGSLGPKTKALLEKEELKATTARTQTQFMFKPGQNITRAEIAKIALKVIELDSSSN